MLAPVRLTRLTASVSIVDAQGRPTPVFLRYFNDVLKQLELTINGVIDAQGQALIALEQALDALSAAAEAQLTADEKLAQAQADELYVKQDTTPPWGAPAGSADRSTLPAYSAPTVSPTPTQAEVQGIADAAQALNRRVTALISDLVAAEALTG